MALLLVQQLPVLQWGQRLSALDTIQPFFNETHYALLQWGQRLSALDTHASPAILCTWEELQWGQRLSALDTDQNHKRLRDDWVCFNGANAFQRWIRAGSISWEDGIGVLQWGQRLSALDTAFSPRFSLIIPLFGGECRHFARGSFFWMPNRAGFRPSEPIFARFFANAPSWAVRRRSVRSAVLTIAWISRARAAGRIRLSRNGARRVMRRAAAPVSARASGGFRILGRPGRRARPARSC